MKPSILTKTCFAQSSPLRLPSISSVIRSRFKAGRFRCFGSDSTSSPPKSAKAPKAKAPKTTWNAVICGFDEAGRGSALGPMVLAACVVARPTDIVFQIQGVKDSKVLSEAKRTALYEIITKVSLSWKTLHITAQEIDARRAAGENLNQIEFNSAIKLLESLPFANWTELYVDAFDVDASRLTGQLQKKFPKAFVLAEHAADKNHIIVGAASILAKVERDLAMKELEKTHNVPLGSGYPADPVTNEFLKALVAKQRSEWPDFVRKSWKLKVDSGASIVRTEPPE